MPVAIVAKFKCVETKPTNQNTVAEEIKSKSHSRNASHHSDQNLLSLLVRSNNVKSKIWACRTTILHVLCGCETASYIERKKRLRLTENLVLRKIFGT
jgi:hypothetical protein